MNVFTEARSDRLATLDGLFAMLGGASPDYSPEATQPPPSASMDPTPPPEIHSPEDLQAAVNWLRSERSRLEAYTRAQLARLAQERQLILQQNSANEQALILRSQELSRREEWIQEQARQLSQREQALASQLQQWWEVNEQLAAAQEINESLRQETERLRALQQTLLAETASLQQTRDAAEAELDRFLKATEGARQTRQLDEASLGKLQAWLEQKILQVEKAELSVTQRQAELDDLENRLQAELEEQERSLAQRARELQEQESRLRQWQESLERDREDMKLLFQRVQRRPVPGRPRLCSGS